MDSRHMVMVSVTRVDVMKSNLKNEIRSIVNRLVEIEEMFLLNDGASELNINAIISLYKIIEFDGPITKQGNE